MRKTKQEKGITLVALIITIVVLLILAVVAIGAVQNDGIIDYAKNARKDYQTAQNKEEDMLDQYLSYIQGGENWTTVFEGNATTDENGSAILGETDLFLDGYPYKITVVSDEYTGTVETVAKLVDVEEGSEIYLLFALENGEAIGLTLFEDSEDKIANLGGNAITVGAIETEGMCEILFDGATSEFTITKIERLEVEESIEKYFLGENGTGILITDIYDSETETFIYNTWLPSARQKIKLLMSSAIGTIGEMFVKYDNELYKISFDPTTGYTKSIELVYTKQGREGQTVAYDSNNDGVAENWVILTDRNGLVEIVSAKVMGSLELGYGDTSVKVTSDIDKNGTIGDDADKAILSYNNAITRINDYCDELVKATNNSGVRSVGGTNNVVPAYHSTNYDNWGKDITIDVASGDNYWEEDYYKMIYMGIINSNEEFWFASRSVMEESDLSHSYVYFGIRNWEITGSSVNYQYLWYVNESKKLVVNYWSESLGVHPVVINPSGI